MRLLITCAVAAVALAGCGKKSDDDAAATPPAGQAKDPGTAYSTITASAGKLNLAAYKSGTSLQNSELADGLALADENWTAAQWGDTARFNCFGSCSGSVTAKQYLSDALNKDKSGPMGTVVQGISTFCFLGATLDSSAVDAATGIPIIGTYSITVTDALKSKLKTDCSAKDDEITQLSAGKASVVVADAGSTAFDRLITFKVEGSNGTNSYPFYFKNSGSKISIGTFEKTGTTSGTVTHSIFSQDVDKNLFRMEYFSRTFPVPARGTAIGSSGSYSFYRGFYDSNTKETRFFSSMGNSNYFVNATFLALNGNGGEDQAGAYFHRTSEDTTALAGAFVCYKKDDGSYINNSGCTTNSSKNRKQTWTSESPLWVKVTAKTSYDDWSATPVDIPSFDADTMFTLEPNYK